MAGGLDRFDVYRVAREFNVRVAEMSPSAPAFARDQLDRAAASILQNIAEGAGRRSLPDQRRFYVMAYGSANECIAIPDILRIRKAVDGRALATAEALLLRIVRMLVKLTGTRTGDEALPETETETSSQTETETSSQTETET